jgi:hypothetical protein
MFGPLPGHVDLHCPALLHSLMSDQEHHYDAFAHRSGFPDLTNGVINTYGAAALTNNWKYGKSN